MLSRSPNISHPPPFVKRLAISRIFAMPLRGMPTYYCQNPSSLPRSKVKSVFVASKSYPPISASASTVAVNFLFRFNFLDRYLYFGGQALQKHVSSLRKDQSLLPLYLPWPTNCQSSWVPNRTTPQTAAPLLLVFRSKHQAVPPFRRQTYRSAALFFHDINQRFLH